MRAKVGVIIYNGNMLQGGVQVFLFLRNEFVRLDWFYGSNRTSHCIPP